MDYYIEVPFRTKDDSDVHYHVGASEMILTQHMAALRISGRQFDRITKAFREIGQPHMVTELIDPADGRMLGTLLTTDAEGRGRMITAPAGAVIRDAYLEITLADEKEPAFADNVRNAEVRIRPAPGRPTLKQASLTVTFQATDPPGTVGQLIWDNP